jgi:hypothetical protein
MEFENAAIALLASMVLVLAGMVGWLYWQQTRMFQNMNNIVMALGELAQRQFAPQPELVEEEDIQITEVPPTQPEDDRLSVEEDEEDEKPAVVDGPLEIDGLEQKSLKELRDMLTKKGIPFGKRDTKGVLISLLKATA